MSAYFRRVIANKILRILSKKGKLSPLDVEKLETKVALLVQTQDVRRKTRIGDPQYRVDCRAVLDAVGIKDLEDIRQNLSKEQDIEVLLPEKNALLVGVNSDAFCKQVLQDVQIEGEQYGCTTSSKGHGVPQTILVEYSSPNIAKPFHAGHLRSTIIGNFVANLYESTGHKVHRINWLGDWGTQFGLLALGFHRYGNEELLKLDPLLQLFKVYVQINKDVEDEKSSQTASGKTYKSGLEMFSKLEAGDQELTRLWKMFRELSVKEYGKMYERLGVSFTDTHFESDYSDQVKDLLNLLREKDLLQHDNSIPFQLSVIPSQQGVGFMSVDDRGQCIKATLVKSDGSSLYLSRDVAAALDRQKCFNPDCVHYIVEAGQQLHFRQLVGVLRELGVPWAYRPFEDIHVQFGRIEGMSSRRGSVVFLRDILDEARDRIAESMQTKKTTKTENVLDVADILAVSAVVVQDMREKRLSNYTFSWDRMLDFSADSGVFMQYAHARLCSMFRSCGIQKTTDVDFTCLHQDAVFHLLMMIARYPEVVQSALASLEPCNIVQYLLRLCHLINAAYGRLPVKGEEASVAQARLLVFDSARQVLCNGLQLIGLKPVTEM